jgi:PAS domain-containing protein
MPTSSHDAARRAARVAAALAGRAELLHAVLDAAAHLTHAQAAGLWLGDRRGGTFSVTWPAASDPTVGALERAARDAAEGQLQRRDAHLSLVGAPLRGASGGLAVASSQPDRAFEPREVALLGILGQQAGAALDGWGSERPFWAIAEHVFDAPPQAGWPDALADGVFWLDARGGVLRVNRAGLELLEPPTAPAGQPLAALVPDLPADVLAGFAAAPPAAVSVCRLALPARSSDRPRALTLVGLPSGTGRLVLLADAATRAGVRAFEALVVSNAAHELRTPLTAIRAHAEIIPDLIGGRRGDLANRFLQVIDAESQRMGGLLDDLRDALGTEGPSLVLHRPTRPEASS